MLAIRHRCLVILLVGACTGYKNVPCAANTHCDLQSGGVCVEGPSASWCAYPDTTCTSGLRYSDFDTGDGVSGECVSTGQDAGMDGTSRRCDPTKDFQVPTPLQTLNSSLEESSFTITSNELLGFFHRESPITMRMAVRSSQTGDFEISAGTPLDPILAVEGTEYMPSTSSDGLVLYFVRSDQTTSGVYVAVRGSTTEAFATGTDVSVDGSRLLLISPQVSRDGATLYWYDYASAERRIFAGTRGSLPSQFSTRRAATSFPMGINYAISSDELTLYYSDAQSNDIFRATRASKDLAFAPGIPLSNVNSTAQDMAVAVSDDDCILYLRTNRPGGSGVTDLWTARRP